MRTNWAKAVRRGLILEILRQGKVETTLAKARSVRGEIDKVVNLLKEGTLNARRQVVKILGQEVKVKRNFTERKSGHTRLVRLGKRLSDAAEMVVLELIEAQAIGAREEETGDKKAENQKEEVKISEKDSV